MKRNIGIFIALLFLTAIGCEREQPNEVIEADFQFNISKPTSSLKSTATFDDARKMILSIEQSDGTPTEYYMTEMSLMRLGDDLVSPHLSLPCGSYNIIMFLLLHDDNEVKYAVPTEESPLESLVVDPIPISFDLSCYESSAISVSIEVLSTAGRTIDDFGLHEFDLSDVTIYQHGDTLVRCPLDSTILIDDPLCVACQWDTKILASSPDCFEPCPYDSTIAIDDPLCVAPPDPNIVTDIDGNVYPTVDIGMQTWMAENLKVTTYNDGYTIPYVGSDVAWANLTADAFSWPDNDLYYKDIQGGIYNYPAIATNKLCPTGWHVPTLTEVETLGHYLGGVDDPNGITIAGGKMKVTGTADWLSPNTGATNSSGFSGKGHIYRIASNGAWVGHDLGWSRYWTSTSDYAWSAHSYGMFYGGDILQLSESGMNRGISVRCVKD